MFLFGQRPDGPASSDFRVGIPIGIRTKDELLAWYAAALAFPSYFGMNWDALSDALRDLSWITERRVIIDHQDIPLSRDQARTYLQVLSEAILDWQDDKDHELVATFPSEMKELVAALLA